MSGLTGSRAVLTNASFPLEMAKSTLRMGRFPIVSHHGRIVKEDDCARLQAWVRFKLNLLWRRKDYIRCGRPANSTDFDTSYSLWVLLLCSKKSAIMFNFVAALVLLSQARLAFSVPTPQYDTTTAAGLLGCGLLKAAYPSLVSFPKSTAYNNRTIGQCLCSPLFHK